MPIELLVEAAEDDRLLVDVLLPQGRAVRVCLEVLARVVQVIASPASGKTKYYVNAAYCYEGYSYFRFRWSYGEPRFPMVSLGSLFSLDVANILQKDHKLFIATYFLCSKKNPQLKDLRFPINFKNCFCDHSHNMIRKCSPRKIVFLSIRRLKKAPVTRSIQ